MFVKQNIEKAISVLKQRFGNSLSTSKSILEQHTHTTSIIKSELPDAIIFPENKKDILEIVNACSKYKCPIIPFAVGSSLEGHVNAPFGGISIDLNKMNRILKVNQEDMDVIIEPGVTREQLNEHLRDTGLFFPIDPGANASLGGMAASGASGTNAVRYGTMKENILSLEAVMPYGNLIKTGTRARKTSAGYDLTRLIIGSEGTLGIITELTVKLVGIPEEISGGICSFPSIKSACNAVINTIQYGIPIARIELLDELQVRACNNYSGLSLPETPLLLIEFHGTKNSVSDQAKLFSEISSEYTNEKFIWTTDPKKRAELWKARHNAYWASHSLMPGANGISTDVCVPISKLADCVEETKKDLEANNIISTIVGHVGDGNFHCLPLCMPGDVEMEKKIKDFTNRLSARAISYGGTCTGEHGIGQGKIDYLIEELGDSVNIMHAIKKSLDPDNIFNPGKIFK